jgi:hypothetical protein
VGKLSISLDDALEAELRDVVGDAKVSPFIAEAVRNELARHRLGDFLDELDVKLGPVPPQLLEEAGTAFDAVAASSGRRRRSTRRA